MKKTYITPTVKVREMKSRSRLLAGSVVSSGLDGFGGYGGTKSSGSAASRDYDFDDDEDY